MDIFYSSIHPHFLRRIYRRSSFSAFPILIFFLFVGIFGTPFFFSPWGLFFCTTSMATLLWGLIIFFKLKRLKKHPHTLHILPDKWRFSTFKKKKIVVFPSELVSIDYVQKKNVYGVSLKTNKQTVFLPFFSRLSYARMHDIMHTNKPN